jgi:hydrogenase expression/formation protein HypE
MKRKQIKAILFDFDGTLTRPGSIDFAGIKQAIRIPRESTILDHINGLSARRQKAAALKILEKFEASAARRSRPNAGAEALIRHLRRKELKLGILTRNSLRSVRTALRNFKRTRPSAFDVIVTRESVTRFKPHPEGVLIAAGKMQVAAAELMVVGDYYFDIEAGREAGALTVFVDNSASRHKLQQPPDFIIKQLNELKPIIEKNISKPYGAK